MADILKTMCDGPGCTHFHEIPEQSKQTAQAPAGWLVRVEMRIGVGAARGEHRYLRGDFCSDACLLAKIADIRDPLKGKRPNDALKGLNLGI